MPLKRGDERKYAPNNPYHTLRTTLCPQADALSVHPSYSKRLRSPSDAISLVFYRARPGEAQTRVPRTVRPMTESVGINAGSARSNVLGYQSSKVAQRICCTCWWIFCRACWSRPVFGDLAVLSVGLVEVDRVGTKWHTGVTSADHAHSISARVKWRLQIGGENARNHLRITRAGILTKPSYVRCKR